MERIASGPRESDELGEMRREKKEKRGGDSCSSPPLRKHLDALEYGNRLEAVPRQRLDLSPSGGFYGRPFVSDRRQEVV